MIRNLVALALVVSVSNWGFAEDLWLANQSEFPGRLRVSEGGTVPRVVFTRADRPDPAYPDAIMKVGQIAVTLDRQVYYCSGLDGSVMHLLDGRHEIQPFTFPGQIRDLACTGELHTVYFSTVATPQNGAALADGAIYRRDLWEGQPQLLATIPQRDVNANWWGVFTIRDQEIYLATADRPSRLYRWAAGALAPVFPENRYSITGLSVSPDHGFFFADGTGTVRHTQDFRSATDVLITDLRITEVAHRALESP